MIKEEVELTPALQTKMLEQMNLIRLFEEKADELFAMGRVHGTMHLSIGQEAAAVGTAAAIREDDLMLSTHRGHGHSLARGAEASRMMAEFMGKETGYCRGRGGSMHIADVERGILGANGIVGGGLPIAAGVGLAIQMRHESKVVVTFFGDGAMNEGAFHESMNLSAIWKLPVVYVCENNQYAMSMPVTHAFAISPLSERAKGYGVPGVTVDGNDVLAVYQAVSEAADRARRGEGPSLVECVTYRWKGHSKSDQQKYRTRAELEQWKKRDPIVRFEQHLITTGVITEAEAEEIRNRAQQEIEAAVEFADASPEPSVEGIMEGVYA